MNTYKTIQSKIYYLKMLIKPAFSMATKVNTSIKKLKKPISSSVYIALYKSVGENLNWLDRIFMDEDALWSKINDAHTHIYLFNIDNKQAGYSELVQADNGVEIVYFGLTPEYVGKGYGKYFLQKTIQLAWNLNPEYVHLNTCDLDHPNALPTYKSLGFVHYKSITESKKIIDLD